MRERLIILAMILVLLSLGNPGVGFLCIYLLLLASWGASAWKFGPKVRLTLGVLSLLLTALLSYYVSAFFIIMAQPDYRSAMRQLTELAASGETKIIGDALNAYNQEITTNGHSTINIRNALWKMQDVICADRQPRHSPASPAESKTGE